MTDTLSTDAGRFREAMASFPSGVTIVTTTDGSGKWRGFTATSFCSVSMEPPLVLVCLAASAECHPAFTSAARWLVHVITDEHTDLAMRFATRGTDKFAQAGFAPNEYGLPTLNGAAVTLECSTYAIHPAGDHTILLGQVDDVRLGDSTPTLYYRRDFHHLEPVSGS
ncbi:flavin reductase family protein [Streptomyces muensis]|uniref:Flavin reductase family protein n=1 Tax=Streptomyces muensis TaxID=1077944 RepID=A0A9X1TJH4_STRM4|nr:flavin reductase family protein [Streptomyces muensis]MCF1592584.1 flavin reductase family protein [Streptomyces muensis]